MSKSARTISKAAEEPDFDAIEDAVRATEQGRWFLQEFARRNRTADTDRLLAAIEQLYERASRQHADADTDHIHRELAGTYAVLQDTRSRMAELHGGVETVDPVAAAMRAATDIAVTAERMREIAESFRKNGMNEDLCEEMDQHIAGILAAASRQEMSGRCVALLSLGLGEFEARLSALLDLWVEKKTMEIRAA